ncbi:hypothetical protein [Streptomyces sp. NBC_01244]|uniref:hypothetical protein n=1 Tax=Streptomyces sp. NBC_01244 TaxID=2903797 RepID=UPI002E0DF3FB|nr:hypothetical protein OG247_44530 [Streptomyces sp. NBC_01244]
MDASAKSLELAYRDELVALDDAERKIRALANTIMQRTTRVERLHIAREELARVTGQPAPVDARAGNSRRLLAQLSALGIIPGTHENVANDLRAACERVGAGPADYGIIAEEPIGGEGQGAPAAETVEALPDPERAEIPQDPLFDADDLQTPGPAPESTANTSWFADLDAQQAARAETHASSWYAAPRAPEATYSLASGYAPPSEGGPAAGQEAIRGVSEVQAGKPDRVKTGTLAEPAGEAVVIPAQAKAQEAGADDANLTELTYKVLAAAVEPLTAGDVAQALGATLGREVDSREVENTRNRLNRLKKAGRAVQPGRGLWAAPTAPAPSRKRKKAAVSAAESVAGH